MHYRFVPLNVLPDTRHPSLVRRARLIASLTLLAITIGTPAGWSQVAPPPAAPATTPDDPSLTIFDGKSLGKWQVIEKFDFDGHGEVRIVDGVIYLDKGKPATGIAYKGELPRSNYRLTFQGQRVEGSDFFCGLTFPVKDEYCTLILGGWGGQVVGLSNIDGNSAIENSTTQAFDFKNGTWYRISLTVLDDRITVLIDDKRLIDLETKDHRFSIWWEQEPVTPLGIVTWYTTGAIKDLKLIATDK